VVEGGEEFGGVDVGVVEGAVAAVGEQVPQRCDPGGVWVVGVFEDRGDLQQLGAYCGDAIVQYGCAVADERVGCVGVAGGAPQPFGEVAAVAFSYESCLFAPQVAGSPARRDAGGLFAGGGGRSLRLCGRKRGVWVGSPSGAPYGSGRLWGLDWGARVADGCCSALVNRRRFVADGARGWTSGFWGRLRCATAVARLGWAGISSARCWRSCCSRATRSFRLIV
jgi:hypothetical protein